MNSRLDPRSLKKRLVVVAVCGALTLSAASSHASALGFVETADEAGVNGANNPDNTLFSPSSVAVTPDGNHVYLAAAGDNAITVFSRDPATGRLTRTSALVQDGTAVDGLLSVDEIIVSPDGKSVYAIGDSRNFIATLTVFARDSVSGALTRLQSLNRNSSLAQLSRYRVHMAFSPDGKFLHVTAEGSQALIVLERLDDGTLAFKQAFSPNNIGVALIDSIRTPWDIALSSDGQSAYVVSSGGAFIKNSLAVFSRDATTGMLTITEAHYSGANGVVMMTAPQAVEVSPDGKYVYALSAVDGTIVTFSRAADGKLTFVESHHHMDPTGTFNILLGAKTLTVSTDGQLVYVGAESTSIVAVMRRNTDDGTLKLIGYERNGLNNLTLGAPQSIALSPDEKQIYAATSGLISGVTVFDTTTDLGIVIQDDADPAAAGGTVNYSLMVTNGGASDATNVVVTGGLPAGSTFVSAVTDVEGGVCELVDTTFSCTVPRVAITAAASATVTLTLPSVGGVVAFGASVSADQIDADVTSDADVEETTVTAPDTGAANPPVVDNGGNTGTTNPPVVDNGGATGTTNPPVVDNGADTGTTNPADGSDSAPVIPGSDANNAAPGETNADAPASGDQPANDTVAGGSSDGGGGAVGSWWLLGLLAVVGVRARRRIG